MTLDEYSDGDVLTAGSFNSSLNYRNGWKHTFDDEGNVLYGTNVTTNPVVVGSAYLHNYASGCAVVGLAGSAQFICGAGGGYYNMFFTGSPGGATTPNGADGEVQIHTTESWAWYSFSTVGKRIPGQMLADKDILFNISTKSNTSTQTSAISGHHVELYIMPIELGSTRTLV